MRLKFGVTLMTVLAGLVSSGARAECPPYPDVPWWKGLSHGGTMRYVAEVHDGDWKLYLAKWKHQLTNLEIIHGRGSAGVIRSQGLRLEGEELRRYIERVRQRIAVAECLAREYPVLPKVAQRAAGGEEGDAGDHPVPPLKPQSAPTSPPPGAKAFFKPEIEATCTTEGPIFRIVNRGDKWPAPADFVVFHQGKSVAERRLRMTTGQTVEFRVDGSGLAELRITPDWDPLDVRKGQVTCR